MLSILNKCFGAELLRAKSTDCEAMILLRVFDTDFVAVISSRSEGLGKMALGIVKIYLGSPFSGNRRCSRSVGLWSVVMDLSCCTDKMKGQNCKLAAF